MAMPFTRPLRKSVTSHAPGTIARGATPTVTLPPSQGVRLPYGQGIVHTVKNPKHRVTAPASRPVPAQVS